MNKAIIGYTGFVGSNLIHQYKFNSFYNSKNYKEISSLEYEIIVCAGVKATKWIANKYPNEDFEEIKNLTKVLKKTTTKKFILISTIDVYNNTKDLDEDGIIDSFNNDAYGSNRYELENFCKNHFSDLHIVRLPALFGPGLKKNIIYDLINNNCLEWININSSFQYYYILDLWKDIERVMNANIPVVNLFTEPIQTNELVKKYFPLKKIGLKAQNQINYNLKTKYSCLWNKDIPYIYSKDEIMIKLKKYFSII